MSRRRVLLPRPEILLSPLVDVIFILLVFVVLVARFVDREELGLQLPTSVAGAPTRDAVITVHLALDGETRVQGRTVPAGDLTMELSSLRGEKLAVLVLSDAEVPVQRAVDALSAAKLAGFESVAVATRPEGP